MSPFGTKREFSPERLKGRKPPHCRRSASNVGLPTPHNAPVSPSEGRARSGVSDCRKTLGRTLRAAVGSIA